MPSRSLPLPLLRHAPPAADPTSTTCRGHLLREFGELVFLVFGAIAHFGSVAPRSIGCSAVRLAVRVEHGPYFEVLARPDQPRHRLQGTGRAGGADRHHDRTGQAGPRHLRCARRVRAGADFGAHQNRPGIGAGEGSPRWRAIQDEVGKASAVDGRQFLQRKGRGGAWGPARLPSRSGSVIGPACPIPTFLPTTRMRWWPALRRQSSSCSATVCLEAGMRTRGVSTVLPGWPCVPVGSGLREDSWRVQKRSRTGHL